MSRFVSIEQLRAACLEPGGPDMQAMGAAISRQATLTKPEGSLGRLEALAVLLAGWQGKAVPKLDRVAVIIFAGSHGVTAQGVSAFPAEVTAQMVANFAAGGAAINQLAGVAGAELQVVPLEIDRPTVDFTHGEAMAEDEFLQAVSTGYESVAADMDLLCLGEMGIGNTTAAAALAAALFGGNGVDWVGRGTGVDDAGIQRKADVVEAAMAFHADRLNDPLAALACVGGRELAAIFGAVVAARHHRIPVLLDGFVCTAAAAPLARLTPEGLDHAIAAHVSAEAGHRRLLGRLGLKPLLDFDMRLGEGSGACLAVNILRSAVACHCGMASFAEAGVSEK